MNKTTQIVVILAIAVVIIFIALGFMGFNIFGQNQAPSPAPSSDQNDAALQSVLTNLQQTGAVTQLQGVDVQEGTGDTVAAGDTVDVLYTGMLPDGTVFDASSLHGNQPFEFTVGTGYVIPGWDQGLIGMKVGGRRILVIPPQLGYGQSGMGSAIPPNATLVFEVQLVSRTPAGAAPTAPAGQ
jgi:FKBP-type peptidyl-prolyl cis-trans isomerase